MNVGLRAELIAVILTVSAVGFARPMPAQDTIVLRSLEVAGGKVAELTDAGIAFEDGRRIPWQQALKSNLGSPLKSEFEKQVAEKGWPLFRTDQLLRNKDLLGLQNTAEMLHGRLQTEPAAFTDEERFLILVAAFKSRVATGRRPDAVLPFLRAARIRRQKKVTEDKCVAFGFSDASMSVGVTTEILPVWFDQEAARNAAKQVEPLVKSDLTGSTGELYYLASLHLKAGDLLAAKLLIKQLENRTSPLPKGWREILQTQFDIADGRSVSAISRLQKQLDSFPIALRMTANYLIGVELGKDPQSLDLAVLTLLKIPAAEQQKLSALNAAALYQASQLLQKDGQEGEVLTVENELLNRFSNTYHARLIKLDRAK